MDRQVKVMLREDDIEDLDKQAETKGIPRALLLRQIIEGYLSEEGEDPDRYQQGTQPGGEALTKALEESQQEREVLRVRVEDLERTLTDKSRDLEWTRGQLQNITVTLTETVKKIPAPVPALTEAGHKPTWWGWVTGKE